MAHNNYGTIPGRIQAAQSFLERYLYVVDPPACWGGGGRELTRAEQAAYDAAIQAMRLYLSGEMDFGDRPISPPAEEEPACAPNNAHLTMPAPSD